MALPFLDSRYIFHLGIEDQNFCCHSGHIRLTRYRGDQSVSEAFVKPADLQNTQVLGFEGLQI